MAVQHEASVPQPARQQTQQEYEQVVSPGGISYLEAGRPEAPPLVFLHGIGGAARAFRGQLDHFGENYRAIAWDMPGYGNSTPLPLVTMDALAAALAGFIEELGLRRPVLVGHSLGGMVVQRLLGTERMAARIPGAQYVALDGVGHLAHLEQPRAFNAAVGQFLRGLPGDPAPRR